jgi:hypothetical protein
MSKKRVTFSLSEATIELAKDTVVWVQSKGERISLSQFVENALLKHITMTMDLHDVTRVPKRKRELSRGRLIT